MLLEIQHRFAYDGKAIQKITEKTEVIAALRSQ